MHQDKRDSPPRSFEALPEEIPDSSSAERLQANVQGQTVRKQTVWAQTSQRQRRCCWFNCCDLHADLGFNMSTLLEEKADIFFLLVKAQSHR